jgi:sec-independent protein translocase protein TatC
MAEDLNRNVEMTFWDHLEDLRWVFLRSIIAILVFSILAFIFKNIVFDAIILAPKEPGFFTNVMFCRLGQWLNVPALCLNGIPLQIVNIKLAGQFTTHMFISFMAGLVVASPYVIYEFWRFIKPALNETEQRNSRGAVIICSLLFISGVLFAYYIILPLTLNFLGSYQVSSQVANTISLESYISNVISVTLSVGVVFEIPVLVYFLTRIGIITPTFMRKNRKIVFVILLVLAGIITPPDIFSQILVCIPLVILYEASIKVSSRVYNKYHAE